MIDTTLQSLPSTTSGISVFPPSKRNLILKNINLLLTKREGHTGEYWPEVVAVRTERSEVRTKTTENQYSPVRLELARLVSSLLYGSRAMLVLNFPAFENKKYTAYDHFHGNGPYGKIPTKKEPIRTLGFALPYNKAHLAVINIVFLQRIFISILRSKCFSFHVLPLAGFFMAAPAFS